MDDDASYRPDIFDAIAAVLVLGFAWWIDLHGRIAAFTDPLVTALLALSGLY